MYNIDEMHVRYGDLFVRELELERSYKDEAAKAIRTAYEEVEKINLSNIENSQLNLYAIWENEKGIITFNSNDKNNNTKEQIVTLNENIKLDSNTFKRDGYEFVEWNTESDGTGDKYSDGEIISLSKNVTLYAIWKESFIYKINNYAVDEVNNYISKIMVDTTIENFKKKNKLNIFLVLFYCIF